MESQARTSSDPVSTLEAMHQEPWEYDFFQALRRIECESPELPRLGLVRQRQVSPNTVQAYRDTLRLLLVFASERHGKALAHGHRLHLQPQPDLLLSRLKESKRMAVLLEPST